MTDDDWRLHGQERAIQGARLQRVVYRAPSAAWDHDHCKLCNRKFSERETGDDVAHAGWQSEDEYEWVCDECFADFRERLGFVVLDGPSRRGVELHDAKVVAIEEDAGSVSIDLDAFVHDDRRGDARTGVWQRVVLDFHGATIDLRGSPGAVLSGGSLLVDDHAHENMLPIPLNEAGAIRAILIGADFELRISASSIWMRLVARAQR